MAQATDARRAVRPPLESVREAPFALVRDTTADGQPNDGLTLDGYGAVFNNLAVIDSWEGRFREQIAPGSMKRSFRETPPKIQFDHGRHPMIGSIPIAALRSATEDVDPVLAPEGGAHIIGRVFDNWLMAPVRDAISADPPAIGGMSFRFSVVRESWTYADGKPIKDDNALMAELDRCMYGDVPDDELPIRTLKELKVPEVGPVVWPAYEATSVGMRSKVIDLGRLNDPAQRKLLAEAVFIADRAAGGKPARRLPGRRDLTDTGAQGPDADDDPAALAAALDAVLDQVGDLIVGVDLSTLPADVAQALSLIVAAEATADALLEAMGVFDPDSDEAGELAGMGVAGQGGDADDDPAQLAGALDAVLDEAGELLAGIDMSSLPADVAQACYLIVAAETTADALLEAMGVYDPDSDEAGEPGRSKDVDTQQPTTKVGKRLSRDAQQDTNQVVERPSPLSVATRLPHKSDAQRSTPAVGERPSKSRDNYRRLMVRKTRDVLLDIERKGRKP